MALTKAQQKQKEKQEKWWRDREEEQRKHYIKEEEEYKKVINECYDYMLEQIQKEINGFYAKYAKKEGITLAEAKKRVSELDIKAYERKAKKYVKNKTLKKEADAEMRLYNATMKINRLELLKAQIGLELVDGFDELQKFYEKILTDRTLQEFEHLAGILGKTIQNNAELARVIVNASFHNAKYSDRIWMYQDMMKEELSKLLLEGMVQGKGTAELARHLTKLFGVKKSDAERLMRTELGRVRAEAQKQSYIRNGNEEYKFLAVNPKGPCPICKELNGKVFKVKDMMPGENCFPMHPNCHCTTAPYWDEKEFEEWITTHKDHKLNFVEWRRAKYAKASNIGNIKLSDTTDKWAKEAKKELLKAEESIKNRNREIMEVYDASGKYIMTKRGGASNVYLSILDYRKLKNAVVTHNHPSGGSFSIDDVKFLKVTPISELRVSTNDGVYYLRKPAEWPAEINSRRKIEIVLINIKNELKQKYQKMYNEGKIDKKQRHQMLSDEVNRTFAERYGLEYGRETFE